MVESSVFDDFLTHASKYTARRTGKCIADVSTARLRLTMYDSNTPLFKQVREAGVVVEVSLLSSEWVVKVTAEVCAWRVSALAAA